MWHSTIAYIYMLTIYSLVKTKCLRSVTWPTVVQFKRKLNLYAINRFHKCKTIQKLNKYRIIKRKETKKVQIYNDDTKETKQNQQQRLFKNNNTVIRIILIWSSLFSLPSECSVLDLYANYFFRPYNTDYQIT